MIPSTWQELTCSNSESALCGMTSDQLAVSQDSEMVAGICVELAKKNALSVFSFQLTAHVVLYLLELFDDSKNAQASVP